MILFPHCKINLGLHITARREDGYHEIETLFYPVRGLCDAVEILPGSTNGGIDFSSTGLAVDCPEEKNLCVRAAKILRDAFPEPFAAAGGVRIHLHKTIPFGAGLGGGSADATAVLVGLNEVLALGLTVEELVPFAARLGSDTVFFLYDRPMLGAGRGERLEPFPGLDLAGWRLLLVKPPVGVSTAEAYSLITPRMPEAALDEILRRPVEAWRGRLVNDFEEPLFRRLPVLGEIRAELYRRGAVYAALSGSGSTLFGLFPAGCEVLVEGWPADYFVRAETL
ncbi:4-(cytidine 5'-diphospho)-2-C-methyl-D-erythritol kinase [uncultured Rikenella sp.]|uniref:4-(cytidine 5'-diphospho)-2-C-methyl-D-erythritol kinase n=1 Tax=uncultured Rikenella sp. TaxID=368003 RepID=UPI002625CF81|nr:4-(cytidine 5'-diphospho)-2-C-methyl-D-erythritol kinase [uncultured Rikenella sp.]